MQMKRQHISVTTPFTHRSNNCQFSSSGRSIQILHLSKSTETTPVKILLYKSCIENVTVSIIRKLY